MSGQSRVTIHKGTAALIGAALLLTGAGASFLFIQSSTGPPEQIGTAATDAATGTPAPAAAPETVLAGNAPLPEVVVALSAEAIERAGIVVAPVASGTSAGEIRLPGTVEPNAYREVAVTPLVAGRVTRVSAELGVTVRRGQNLAQIYSPELAEAQTKYVSAVAMLDAHARELQRTQKLVEIGAASRQEMERIHAEHAAQTAAVQSAQSQLELLGLSTSAINALGSGGKVTATITVPAPIHGVITERAANVGLNVDPATVLFTVVDLSTVWIIADLYEKDFSDVQIGNDVAVRTAAYPSEALRGTISYIDPQVNPETRTAEVRVEVPNPRGALRLGMYADVVVARAAQASTLTIPRSAVQNVGDRTVVYVADPKQPGQFAEREVRLGDTTGERVEVTSGVQPGDVIVTEGSFFVRSERERLGLRPAAAMPPASGPPNAINEQSAKIIVNEQGFEPASVSLRPGTPARLTFLRTTENTCGTDVVFPSLNITRALPLNEPVVIELTPSRAGEIAFACGMNMFEGSVVVQ